jgi:putative DNA primase/helicase
MSWEESFRAVLRDAGIDYSGPMYIDGKLHRIKANGDHSNNSWYVLYPGSPVTGAYGCWKRDLKETWCERNGSLTQSERHDVRQRW